MAATTPGFHQGWHQEVPLPPIAGGERPLTPAVSPPARPCPADARHKFVNDLAAPPMGAGRPLPAAALLSGLPPEVFEHIFASLADGRALQAAAGACKKWRTMCLEKSLWLLLTRRRFFVDSVNNPRLHRGGPDSFGWMDLYKSWESSLKLPASNWTRERVFPVFAHSVNARMLRKLERKQREEQRATKQRQVRKARAAADADAAGSAAGSAAFVAEFDRGATVAAPPPLLLGDAVGAKVWVTVRHYEDCKLRQARPGAGGSPTIP